MARSITLMGQFFINKAAIEKNRYIGRMLKEPAGQEKDRRIYSDTDSVTGDSVITINGKEITISEFCHKFFAEDNYEDPDIYTVFGKAVLPVNGYSVTAYENGQDISTPVKYVMRHPVSKKMYKIKAAGKEVIVTEDHSVMFKRNGQLMSGTVLDMKPGDVLVLEGE